MRLKFEGVTGLKLSASEQHARKNKQADVKESCAFLLPLVVTAKWRSRALPTGWPLVHYPTYCSIVSRKSSLVK
jgi:hypothetical protein